MRESWQRVKSNRGKDRVACTNHTRSGQVGFPRFSLAEKKDMPRNENPSSYPREKRGAQVWQVMSGLLG